VGRYNSDQSTQGRSEASDDVSGPEILEVGKDARSDAIASACLESPQEPRLVGISEFRAPGLVQKCRKLFIGSLNATAILDAALSEVRPDLAIIGPEEPLQAGYADILRAHGVPTFGPSKRLAAIETSKSWARRLLETHGIPGNPENRLFESDHRLRAYLGSLASFVVKPDGLTAGKGVRVQGDHFQTLEEGHAYALSLLGSDGRVQIEEKLDGEEFSLQTITDGQTSIHCPPVQDHKRAFDGDTGPNTGGMGSYSCADHSLPFLEPSDLADAQLINEQVIEALERETGEPYRGVLYGGFIATAEGVKLIEYNCRFGDPEAMNVLPILRADFVDLCFKAATGDLHKLSYSFDAKATVCKYVVPENYPGPTTPGQQIHIPAELATASDARWYWAACEQDGEHTLMTGSRAGAVVGIADTIAEAEQLAERAIGPIEASSNVRHRRDIGTAVVLANRERHMRELRSTRVWA
jgi:phosphoribosylamine--glycine ligase